MGNIFSPFQPETSLSTSDSKVSVSVEGQEPKLGSRQFSASQQDHEPNQDNNNDASTTSKRSGTSSSTRKDRSRRKQEDHSSQEQQNDVTPASPSIRSASRPRHSGRKRKQPTFLLNQKEDGKKYVERYQVGLNFVKDDDFRVQRDEEHQGHEIFHDCLKPAGWRCTTTTKSLKSSFVFLAKGTTAETAIEGVTKFYSYQEIFQKWKSDKDFRDLYDDSGSEDEDEEEDTTTRRTETAEDSKTKQAPNSGPPKKKVRSKRGAISPKRQSPKRFKTTPRSSKSKK